MLFNKEMFVIIEINNNDTGSQSLNGNDVDDENNNGL